MKLIRLNQKELQTLLITGTVDKDDYKIITIGDNSKSPLEKVYKELTALTYIQSNIMKSEIMKVV